MSALVEEVTSLLEPTVAAHGFDLEDLTVTGPPAHRVITVIVDSDEGGSLDALADLSRELSTRIDDAPGPEVAGLAAFTLEVTTAGVGRPLTAPRHWRRARGRKVVITLTAGGALTARVGALHDDASGVQVVERTQRGPKVRELLLTDVASARVEVEFGDPAPAELRLCGLDDEQIAARTQTGRVSRASAASDTTRSEVSKSGVADSGISDGPVVQSVEKGNK
ncbi:ribosome maturation factor RimP [Williamsia sterculiae]|uniref:Ribosome maturation factor RimP n=1 Tax=Williamsia sterculiae TaxID=1344003 RepID=A0A1N7EC05_9NOCA|nr:ribosome maturation factor RimP [Williamsia sterculiae]SIR85594.1 ribosome maturation factor RimP [Williamsia sterculiae]